MLDGVGSMLFSLKAFLELISLFIVVSREAFVAVELMEL